MAIFVTGDTHGSQDLHTMDDGYMHRLSTRRFPQQHELTKDDYVVICGDFGGIWSSQRDSCGETADERYGLNWLEKKPFTTLFVPGNHENYDRLTGASKETANGWLFSRMSDAEKQRFMEGYPKADWHGGTVRVIRPSVLMLEPGIFDLNGKKCFAYGGAPSHDVKDGILDPLRFPNEASFMREYRSMYANFMQFRVKSVSWWEQEIPSPELETKAREALDNAGWKADFVFTHDCPRSTRAQLGFNDDLTSLDAFLEEVKQKLDYRHWYFGHFHMDKDMPGCTEYVMYQRITQIA